MDYCNSFGGENPFPEDLYRWTTWTY